MRSMRLFPLAVLLALAACQEEKNDPPDTLTVTVDRDVIKADGTAEVIVTVSGARSAPITLNTTKGTFAETHDKQYLLPGLGGQATLITCDGHVASCAGLVYVSATDASGIGGGTSLRFVGFESCTNGIDDNSNGLIDCADDDCVDATCETASGAVGVCVSDVCVCNATGATETACGDGVDDDCDGAVDCADSDCLGDTCLAPGGAFGACTSAGTCVCTPTSATETTCNDGRDNDCDGTLDCADASCAGQACVGTAGPGTCSSGACAAANCSATEPAGELSCGDGNDNDCDDAIDCADAGCNGRQCGATASSVCIQGACTDTSTGFALEVTPVRTVLPADGEATTDVAISVKRDGQPVSGLSVALAATQGTLSAPSVTTDALGKGKVVYTASATGGKATITATIADPPVTVTATIRLPVLGGIVTEDEGWKYRIMGVKGSGFNEQNVLTVRVLDVDEQPYPAGLAVRFEHRALGGSQLSQSPVSDPPGGECVAPCMYYVGRTDDQGLVRVNLYSGTKAGTLGVQVSATAGGEERDPLLPNVAVIGARANAGAFTIDCDPRNVPAFQDHNCGVSLVEGQYTCVATLMDRFQNMLGTETQVTFASETSRVGQVTATPVFEPFTSQPDLGTATQLFATLGGYLPDDVTPSPGEPSVSYVDQCSEPNPVGGAPMPRVHNPRDGVVTVIAIADGEEAFTDVDGDGVYDAGEPFVDLAEPFVDSDDSGTWTFGEWFLDVNGNGTWDSPNDVWDAYTKIWTQTAIVYTSGPAAAVTPGGALVASRWVNVADFTAACAPTPPPAPFEVVPQYELVDPVTNESTTVPPSRQAYVVVGADWNLNHLASGTAYSTYVMEPAGVKVYYNGKESLPDQTGFMFRYWACDQNGACASRCTATGAAGPCVMRPTVTNYSCGRAFGVVIEGGTEDTGAEAVVWKQTLAPDELELVLPGTSSMSNLGP